MDSKYARLKKAGHAGWGGERFCLRRVGWSRAVARFLRDDIFPKPPGNLLELGCGNGMVSELFAQHGYAVHGIELSEEAVLWARELFDAAGLAGSFRQGNVCAMPYYNDASFDAVVDGNCLHCLIGIDRSKCLAEVRRILRPSGSLVISSMCGRPKSEDAYARFNEQAQCLVENGRPYRTLKPAVEIAEEVREAGFHVSHCEISENAWWDHLTLIAVAW